MTLSRAGGRSLVGIGFSDIEISTRPLFHLLTILSPPKLHFGTGVSSLGLNLTSTVSESFVQVQRGRGVLVLQSSSHSPCEFPVEIYHGVTDAFFSWFRMSLGLRNESESEFSRENTSLGIRFRMLPLRNGHAFRQWEIDAVALFFLNR
jgi:hypothetical protein